MPRTIHFSEMQATAADARAHCLASALPAEPLSLQMGIVPVDLILADTVARRALKAEQSAQKSAENVAMNNRKLVWELRNSDSPDATATLSWYRANSLVGLTSAEWSDANVVGPNHGAELVWTASKNRGKAVTGEKCYFNLSNFQIWDFEVIIQHICNVRKRLRDHTFDAWVKRCQDLVRAISKNFWSDGHATFNKCRSFFNTLKLRPTPAEFNALELNGGSGWESKISTQPLAWLSGGVHVDVELDLNPSPSDIIQS